METASPAAPGVTAEAASILESSPLLSRPYFVRLASGEMSREGFVRSQKAFFFAVRYFSRPMAALVSRLPDSASRMDLVHNLAEEQGDFVPALAHDRTFLAFLATLGVGPETMAGARSGVATDAFDAALMGVCLTGERATATACLGFIEYAFADISAFIGRQVVARGWVDFDNLTHYKLHAEIDRRHAEEFFAGVEADWSAGGERRAAVASGLRLGRHLFARLYDDLAEEAAS